MKKIIDYKKRGKKNKIILNKKKISVTSVFILVLLFLIFYGPKVSPSNKEVSIGKCKEYKEVASFDKQASSPSETINYAFGYLGALRDSISIKMSAKK